MSRYHESSRSRQCRPWNRRARKASPAERLASMERELQNRIAVYGEGSWMAEYQRTHIALEKASQDRQAREERAQREKEQP